MARYGLIGRNIDYSFSRSYFNHWFEDQGWDHRYENFDLPQIDQVQRLKQLEGLGGLNVTIPYKEAIIPYLDDLDNEARKIGAVNTVKIQKDGSWIGYNTDHYGFARSLTEQGMEHSKALILGTGGAAKAIRYVLEAMQIPYRIVSRNPDAGALHYRELDAHALEEVSLIINGTPLGTHPDIEACPDLPYALLHPGILLFDLIYNPAVTRFMKQGLDRGCKVVNGQKMLEYQAQKAWVIWNS